MPWRYVEEEPEILLRWRDSTIEHSYKDDDIELILEFWYVLRFDADPESFIEFDVRELPEFNDTGSHQEIILAHLQNHGTSIIWPEE